MRKLFLSILFSSCFVPTILLACPLTPIRISVGPNGEQGNGLSSFPYISGNGKFVTFQTAATNFFANTTPNTTNVVLYNRKTKSLTLVSKGLDGNPGNVGSTTGDISKSGRYVLFTSNATNLVENDTNGRLDVFLYDRKNNSISRISKSSAGGELNGNSYAAGLSPNGRFATWISYASNVTDADPDTVGDIYLYDRLSDTSELISVSSDEVKADDETFIANSTVTNNGRYVVFTSYATNLVSPRINTGTNRTIYLRDRTAGTTQVISLDSNGTEGVGDCSKPSITPDGKYVGFGCESQLTSNDANALPDAYVRNIPRAKTTFHTRTKSGAAADQGGAYRDIDDQGNYVTFSSESTNLTNLRTNDSEQSYLRKTKGGFIEVLSVNKAGKAGNGNSVWPMISSDAKWATFFSLATNLVKRDTNGFGDVFLVETSVGRDCE